MPLFCQVLHVLYHLLESSTDCYWYPYSQASAHTSPCVCAASGYACYVSHHTLSKQSHLQHANCKLLVFCIDKCVWHDCFPDKPGINLHASSWDVRATLSLSRLFLFCPRASSSSACFRSRFSSKRATVCTAHNHLNFQAAPTYHPHG